MGSAGSFPVAAEKDLLDFYRLVQKGTPTVPLGCMLNHAVAAKAALAPANLRKTTAEKTLERNLERLDEEKDGQNRISYITEIQFLVCM